MTGMTNAIELGKLKCRETLSHKEVRLKKMPYAHFSNSITRRPANEHDRWYFNLSVRRDTLVLTFLDWTIVRRRYRRPPVIRIPNFVRTIFDYFSTHRSYKGGDIIPFRFYYRFSFFAGKFLHALGIRCTAQERRGSSARLFDVSGGGAKNFLNKFSSLPFHPPPFPPFLPESGLLCIIDWLLFYRP